MSVLVLFSYPVKVQVMLPSFAPDVGSYIKTLPVPVFKGAHVIRLADHHGSQLLSVDIKGRGTL